MKTGEKMLSNRNNSNRALSDLLKLRVWVQFSETMHGMVVKSTVTDGTKIGNG